MCYMQPKQIFHFSIKHTKKSVSNIQGHVCILEQKNHVSEILL